jgi:hypothetical protein
MPRPNLYPTEDTVAHAIVVAAREMGVNPLDVAGRKTGQYNVRRARLYAALALRECFDSSLPGAPGNVSFSRMVGGNKCMLTAYDNYLIKTGTPYWWSTKKYCRVRAAVRRCLNQPTALVLRRTPAPPEQCIDVTAGIMGDPPLERSALAEYVERERARQLREAEYA